MDDMLVAAEALQGLRSAALSQQHQHQVSPLPAHANTGSDLDDSPSSAAASTPGPTTATPSSVISTSTHPPVAFSDTDPMDIDRPEPYSHPHPGTALYADSTMPLQSQPQPQPQFLNRVSSLPIVETGIRSISNLYESTKSSSKVVQYSASVLESNLRPLSKYLQHNPVVLEVDDFACRQLDRFTSSSGGAPAIPSSPSLQSGPLPRLPELDESLPLPPHSSSRFDSTYASSEAATRSHLSLLGAHSQTPVPASGSRPTSLEPEPPRYRSRWQQVTAGAVAAAGAGAAVLSEESMKSLRYCLEWLQYAANQLNHHMQSIRSWLASLVSDRAVTLFHPDSQSLSFPSLVAIKRDIADTLRRVVDVVGRYAGSFLRGEARSRVRMFILSLPSRWADLQAATEGRGSDSVEAERVLAFASEAGEILTSIRGLFEQSLSTAEQWVGTLGRVPFVNTLVPQHAQHALASPLSASPAHHHANRLAQVDGTPNSPTLGLASMSLTSPAVVANGADGAHSMLPGAFDGHHMNVSVHGRKRRTAEEDVFPSGLDPSHNDGMQSGVSRSYSGAAMCVEHGDFPANGSGNGMGDASSPSVLLKKRKKGKQQ